MLKSITNIYSLTVTDILRTKKEREVTNMKLFKDNVIIIKGTLYEIVAQNPSTIWVSDGDRVIPLEYHHTSLCRGYVSTKSKGVVEEYSGKFGIGVTVKEHNSRSSRYCYISYYILDEGVIK